MKFSSPSFCYISPIDYLDFTKCSKTHLTLAHLVNDSDIYADFYAQCSARGDYIIMDNSAYELKVPYNTDKLIELGIKCGANAIVLPDYPFQSGKVTIDAANKYIMDFKNNNFHTFFVPQSTTGDLADWIQTYEWAAGNPHIDIIGMSILGIPNAIPNIDPAYARVVMTQMLLDRGSFNRDKHHHYLGLNAGPKLEIPSLLRMKVLDTIDSSGPIWAAICGHKYSTDADSLQAVSKIKLPVNFDLKASKNAETVNRITHNVQLTQDLFTSFNDNVSWYAEED